MTGMDVVIALRREGLKPGCVFVYLVDEAPRDPYALSNSGNVAVQIARADTLGTIDFRPFVGLMVHVTDHVGHVGRHRKVAALIAAVDPAHLIVPIWEGETLAVHQRWAGSPARTETFRV